MSKDLIVTLQHYNVFTEMLDSIEEMYEEYEENDNTVVVISRKGMEMCYYFDKDGMLSNIT